MTNNGPNPDIANIDTGRFTDMRLLRPGSAAQLSIRQELISGYLPLATCLARRFVDRGEPYDDLEQVARLGLIKAVDRYDPWHGSGFMAFAVPTISGEIKRHFRDRAWAIRPPRLLQERQRAVRDAVDELAQRDGRTPRPSAIAEHLQLDTEAVLDTLAAANTYRNESLDAFAEETGTRREPQAGDELGAVDNREQLRTALARLPQRELDILASRFFRDMSQTEIAAENGISQVHVSRLLAQSIETLRTQLCED